MNEVISIIGILVALGIIVVGSLKNLNLIILSSIAAFILSLIHISEPTRQAEISYAVFCLKKKKQRNDTQ